jgi:hypothetical protein
VVSAWSPPIDFARRSITIGRVNVDAILEAFHRRKVRAILIGGMNFLLRHQHVMTFDLDLWVADSDENLANVADALRDLGAQWGRDDTSWGPIPSGYAWLRRQTVFCLTSPYGAIDIFLEVAGLERQWAACRDRCDDRTTDSGIPYVSLSDRDMLACQMALPEGDRRLDRIRYLQQRLQ